METQKVLEEVQSDFRKEIEEKENYIKNKNQNYKQKELKKLEDIEENQKILFQDIQNKSKIISSRLEKLDQEFPELKNIDNCESLKENLVYFQKEFQEILDQKQDCIDKRWKEVNKCEQEYINLIENCYEEYEDLVETSKEQFWQVRKKADEKIQEVEKNLLEKRETIIQKNQNDLNELFKQHEKAEQGFVQLRSYEEEKNYKKLKQLKHEKNREFFDLKIFHENEIQSHEKCLEDMKAIYQLNAEKLNYNYKVLCDKKDENNSLALVLKKKERFFLNLLKKKNDDFQAKDLEFRKTNKKLTEQSKKITKQYKDLHKKFKYFEKADIRRYEEIKEMSLSEIEDLKKKILSCHKILMEQQLLLDFQKNTIENLDPEAITDPKNLQVRSIQSYMDKNESFKQDYSLHGSFISKDSKNNFEEVQNKPKFILKADQKKTLINQILKCTEFLFDDKVKQEIFQASTQEDKLLFEMNVLRKVFYLSNSQQVNDFLSKLHLNCFSFEEQNYDTQKLISSISKILKETNLKEQTVKNSVNHTISQKNGQSLENENRNEKIFWKNMGNVLSEENLQLWKSLEKFTMNYYELLKKRKLFIEDNNQLEEQNQELENLLLQYKKQNKGLIFNPKVQLN